MTECNPAGLPWQGRDASSRNRRDQGKGQGAGEQPAPIRRRRCSRRRWLRGRPPPRAVERQAAFAIGPGTLPGPAGPQPRPAARRPAPRRSAPPGRPRRHSRGIASGWHGPLPWRRARSRSGHPAGCRQDRWSAPCSAGSAARRAGRDRARKRHGACGVRCGHRVLARSTLSPAWQCPMPPAQPMAAGLTRVHVALVRPGGWPGPEIVLGAPGP
jgi:hypothetical protein